VKQFKTIHISVMTGKLNGLRAISTNTTTNPFCVKQNASGKADNICSEVLQPHYAEHLPQKHGARVRA
jgi:hypothetical protein